MSSPSAQRRAAPLVRASDNVPLPAEAPIVYSPELMEQLRALLLLVIGAVTLSALWLLYHYHLIILFRVARMAQATFPGRYLLNGRAGVTVTVPIIRERAMRTYGRLLACPGKCEACSRGTHIFRVYNPPFCSRGIRSPFSS